MSDNTLDVIPVDNKESLKLDPKQSPTHNILRNSNKIISSPSDINNYISTHKPMMENSFNSDGNFIFKNNILLQNGQDDQELKNDNYLLKKINNQTIGIINSPALIVDSQRSHGNLSVMVDKISNEENVDKKATEIEDSHEDNENDNASVLVIILQCETRQSDANITNLKWTFSDPYFTVQVCAVDPPSNTTNIKTLTYDQYLENYSMRKALTYAAEGPYISNSQGMLEPQFWWTDIPVIIVKDSSISNITSSGLANFEHTDDPGNMLIGGIKHRIKTSLDKARNADLFFLCKWNDACNKYTDVEGSGNINHGSMLKWSVQPTATQAIMYTPSSRNYIRESLVTSTITLSNMLNSNIDKGKLLATVFVPNIIDFDIDLATSNDDYNKLNECVLINTSNETSNNTAAIVWFVFILLLMLLLAWFLIQTTIGPTI